MTAIPTTKAEFDAWAAEKARTEAWPQSLIDKATRVSMDLAASTQKYGDHPVHLRGAAKDVKDFADAYAAFKAGNER